MKERPEATIDLTGFKVLIFFCAVAFIGPIAILVFSSVLTSLHYYPLSPAFLGVYVMAGVASPLTGLIGLVSLWARKRVFQGTFGHVERRLRSYTLILSIMNIFAVVIWFMFLPQMIFSIGGTRQLVRCFEGAFTILVAGFYLYIVNVGSVDNPSVASSRNSNVAGFLVGGSEAVIFFFEYKSEIKRLLIEEGLSKVKGWLTAQRSPTWLKERRTLSVIFDEVSQSLQYEEEGNM